MSVAEIPVSDPKPTKVRKTRVAGPKAPSRKENPAGYQLHYLDNAIKTIQKRDDQVTGWGVDGLCKHFGDALASLQEARAAIAGLPADFKAPRKRGGGGGRKAKRFEAGQRVKLTDAAFKMVQELQLDPPVTENDFVVSTKLLITEDTKTYSVGRYVDGNWQFCGFYSAKILNAF